MSSVLTIFRQVFLNSLLCLLHILITGYIQFEDFQITGALFGQALGTHSLWKQAPGKDHKTLVVQPSSQLVAKTAVTASYQHSGAMTIHWGTAVPARIKLTKGKEKHGQEGSDAEELLGGKKGIHVGRASVSHSSVKYLLVEPISWFFILM